MRVCLLHVCLALGAIACMTPVTAGPSVSSGAAAADAKGSDGTADGTPLVFADGAAAGDAGATGDSMAATATTSDATGETQGDEVATGDGSVTADTAPTGCQTPADCDDGAYCTADTCAADGQCSYSAIANCVPPKVPCNSKNTCATGVCDPAANACVQCLQTTDCAKGAICQAKLCKPAQVCKSDIDCKNTKQVCGKASALCVDCNSVADCGLNETCVDTKCSTATPCKSSKDCPAVCNQQKSVCVECVTADDCGVGKFCGGDGRCMQAVCLGPACGSAHWLFGCQQDGSAYLSGQTCEDNSVCTDTGCSTAKGCLQLPNALACDDSSKCTLNDGCAQGQCSGTKLDCNDSNPCTDDSCDGASGCKYLPNAGKCDDNSTCTQNDGCSGGVCKGQGVSCDDANPCTTDDCDSKQACLHSNNTSPCADGNACTDNDSCKDGKCGAGAVKVCTDNNACTTDSCDPKGGCKFVFNGGTACDDGNKCTFNDACTVSGQCAGATGNCDDQNSCTDNTCDPKSGCLFPANLVPCDDKNPCTSGDKCSSGKCQPGTGAPCDDGNPCTEQGCDATKNGCFFTGNTAQCEDGNLCTAGDKCSNGKCFTGGTLVCDDKNACTTDACDAQKGCAHVSSLKCDDGDPCTIDSCNPDNGSCSHTPIAKCCTVGTVLYSQSFDDGSPAEMSVSNSTALAKKGWQVWDPASKSISAKGVLYYGDPAISSYDFGASKGTVTLNIGNLPPSGKRTLEFQLFYEAEKYIDYDMLSVTWEATGKTAQKLWSKASLGTYSCSSGTSNYTCANLPTSWTKISLAVPVGYTAGAKLVLTFDTNDSQYNKYLGVLIDDIKVVQTACE